ncbi:hypothetical protein [Nocardioides sp.]|uniref:hypothetical protein n=1 Tax=Nocardioides sp. TaxID=35761 RepID=UPI0037848786
MFVTNVERLSAGSAAARPTLLVKVNQIGTLTGHSTPSSWHPQWLPLHDEPPLEDRGHRDRADIAVAVNCGQIKTGGPARSDRVAKYNQPLRIEDEPADAARFSGASAFPRGA